MNNCCIVTKYYCGQAPEKCDWFLPSDNLKTCEFKDPDGCCGCWACNDDAEERRK